MTALPYYAIFAVFAGCNRFLAAQCSRDAETTQVLRLPPRPSTDEGHGRKRCAE